MLMMQELRQCGSMWMRDNMAPPTSPTLTWPGSRDQLWWQPMMPASQMRTGMVYRACNRASRLRIRSKWGGLGSASTLSTTSLVRDCMRSIIRRALSTRKWCVYVFLFKQLPVLKCYQKHVYAWVRALSPVYTTDLG